MPRVPQHHRIRLDIERAIRGGELVVGARLPTEAELCATYGVSRTTARHAMQELVSAGLVQRRPRRGSVVASTATEANLLRFTNLTATAAEVHGDHAVLSAKVLPFDEIPEALRTRLLGGSPASQGTPQPVTLLQRTKAGPRGTPIALETSAIPFDVAPHVLDQDLVAFTSMAYLHSIAAPLARARCYLEAVAADQPTAEVLDLEVGTPLLRTIRETWLSDGRLAEVYTADMAPGAISVYVEESITPPERH